MFKHIDDVPIPVNSPPTKEVGLDFATPRSFVYAGLLCNAAVGSTAVVFDDAPPLRLAPLDDDVLQVLRPEPRGALAEQRLVDGPGILRQQGRLQLEDLGW